MGFGDRLLRLRIERDWSQDDVAGKVGVNRATVSTWEHSRREPPLDTVAQLATLFGVSVDFLLGRSFARDYLSGDDAALAERWPRLSPDRRLRAAEIERAVASMPGMAIRFPEDITDPVFDNLLRAFASLTQLLQATVANKKPDH